VRLEPRLATPLWWSVMAPVGAIGVSLVLCAGLIAWSGAPVWRAYGALLANALGSPFAIAETLTRATPLILTGLAAAVAFRAKLWNIGGEGQLYAGALAATLVGSGLVAGSPFLMVPLVLIAGAVAGALLLLGPTLLKTRLGVDEVVTTLLLNFIVLLFVSLLLDGPLKDPMSAGWPQAEPIVEAAELPKLVQGERLHAGLLIAVAAALIVWFIGARTVWGFEMKAVGANPQAATFLGFNVDAAMLRVACLSGGLAGLAGVGEVAGLKGYLTLDLSPGFGYSGIVVAMLAQLHPIGVIAGAVFVAGIFVGADAMSRAVTVPSYIADVIVAVSLLSMMVAVLLLRFRVRRG
jgi:ABC-type uncharacterized transport system permease subunit